MKDWHRRLHVYGNLNLEPPESIAPLIVNALSLSNYTRTALIIDEDKRVLLVQERSKTYQRTAETDPSRIGPMYRCGANPARFGLTVSRIADDIRETLEGMA